MNVKEILRKLVAIPSVSSLSNAPLLDEIEQILTPRGWKTQRFEYVAADGLMKANLVAIPDRFADKLSEVELLFVCHTDTVPYKAEWERATQLTEAGGLLHGCGACDVKGSLAGLLAAAVSVDTAEICTPVAFAFTSEEEIGCIGASRLAASGLLRSRRVLVCEPTSLRPATAGKGYGLAEVRVTGQEAHSAFPAKGASAVLAAAHFISRLESMQQSKKSVGDPRFSPPGTTFNVGIIHGGSAKNIVAAECHFLVEWRPIPSEDPHAGGRMLQVLATEIESERNSCKVEVKVTRADAGFDNPPGSILGTTLMAHLNKEETGISFGSEATRLAAVAGEVVVIGPGDMETAHSERECIPVAELEEWTALVMRLMLEGISVGKQKMEWATA